MDPKRNTKRPRCSSGSTPQTSFNKQKTTITPDCDVRTTTSHQESGPPETEQDAQKPNKQHIVYSRVGTLTCGQWVGPMDPALFIGRFLPHINDNVLRPEFGIQTFAAVLDVSDKSKIYGLFIDAMSRFAPRLKLVDTHSIPDTQWNGVAVDVSAYPVPVDTEAKATSTDFSRIEIPLCFNYKDSDDPFSDSDEGSEATEQTRFPFERDDTKYCTIRGQISSDLSSLAGAQFRLHSFSVLICGKWARLLRWDRNGVIVTRKFAYAEEDHLVEFFWRYSHSLLDDPSRGHDPTVRPFLSEGHIPTPEETAARIKLAEANQPNHREFRTMLIPDRNTDKEQQFLISYPPKHNEHSPFGRATRPMLAFDFDKNMMVFVKDYWRTVGDDFEKEGDIYKLLCDAGVPYIPPFGKGNDVRNHVTLTDIVKSEDWVYPAIEMVSLRHYRMSLEEIGRPLNTFKSSHELVTAVADAMEAHEVAFYDANILHRDISVDNILITEEGRGMLIDWDLCLNMNILQKKPPKRPDLIGTSEFWSASILTNHKHAQGVLDDQESSLYVVLWSMLRYTLHNRVETLSDELKLFDEVSSSGVNGGIRKRLFLLVDHRDFHFDNRPHLNSLIEELAMTFFIRHQAPIGSCQRRFLESPEAIISDPLNYVVRERNIADRSWLVKTMRKYLDPRQEWPTADQARQNPFR